MYITITVRVCLHEKQARQMIGRGDGSGMTATNYPPCVRSHETRGHHGNGMLVHSQTQTAVMRSGVTHTHTLTISQLQRNNNT